MDYLLLYQEYRDIYIKDPQKAKKLQKTFLFVHPEVWTQESVRLRAFLDRDEKFYTTSLAPFEFLLKKKFSDTQQEKYEELIAIYRDEYFLYQDRAPTYLFMLDEQTNIANNFALTQEEELIKEFLYTWQKELDTLKAQNLDVTEIVQLRVQERKILNEYEYAFSSLCSKINTASKNLDSLLSEYTPINIKTGAYKLQDYFQDMYDLSDEVDLIEYLKAHPETHEKNDIFQIRAIIQKQILNNNNEAELAQRNATNTTMGATLLEFATREQEIITHYHSLVARYYSHLGVQGEYLLIHEPFELYFDNYYSDFNRILTYYSLLYEGKSIKLTQTPYYLKMYGATQDKISIVNLNTSGSIEEAKNRYISKRSYLTRLKMLRHEYVQEIEILLDEFDRYAKLYIEEISDSEIDLQKHKVNVDRLKKRFDLREEYGFF